MSSAQKFSLVTIAAMLAASSAIAHQPFAMFDQSKTVRLQGTVKAPQ